MYSFNNALLLQTFYDFQVIMSLTAHLRLGEELNKPSFCSDPDVTLHVVLFML